MTFTLLLVLLSQAPAPSVLTLEQAIKEGSQKNPDIQAAQTRIVQAREQTRQAWSNYLPQIVVGGSYTRNSVAAQISLPETYNIRDTGKPQGPPSNASGAQTNLVLEPAEVLTATIQKLNQFAAQGRITQNLLAPALWPAIRNAYLNEDITALTTKNVRRQVLFNVAQSYFGATSLKEAIGVSEQTLQVAQQHEKDAQVQFDSGSTLKATLLRATIDRIRAEEDVIRAKNNYEVAKGALATLLDRAPDFEVETPPDSAVTIPANQDPHKALAERPDAQAAQQTVELASRSQDAVLYQYAPMLNVTAQYQVANVLGFTGRYASWAVALNLNWALWDGGLRESQYRQLGARTEEALQNWRATQAHITDEIRTAKLDLESAIANRRKAEEQTRLAHENMELAKTNFEAGAATYLEVTDANAALAQAELSRIAETLNAQLAVLRLANALGEQHF